jgi:hypothetical protein
MVGTPGFTTRPELAGTFGMVASTHWLASAAGMAGAGARRQRVRRGRRHGARAPGGRAAPERPGGKSRSSPTTLAAARPSCSAARAPRPPPPRWRPSPASGLDLVPGSGLLPPCVPGSFGAWMLLLREFGTMRLRDVMGYAIGYASAGYPLVPAISWGIASVAGCSASTGRARPRSTCRAARCPRRAHGSPTPRWPPPTSASWTRRSGQPGPGRADRGGPPGLLRGLSSPRRSLPTSPRPRSWM